MNLITPDNLIVHGLWIGNSLSNLELLTLNSFVNNGHIFYLWVYNPISTAIPENVILKDANEIIPVEKIFRYKFKNQFGHGKGSLGGFSDIFRYKLLYEYGGWWTDMDITCLKPLNFIQPYIFRTHHDLKLVGNLMKCPKNSILMNECYEKALQEINSGNKDWNKPIQILVNGVFNHQLENNILEITNPDSWKLIRKFLTRNISMFKNWYAIHWVNEEWRRNHINKDFFKTNSTLGILMTKNGLNSIKVSFKTRILYSFNLIYIVTGFRQMPYFILRKLKK